MIHVSASQIKTFRACVRKWAFEKIAGLRGPETASQTLGKDVDDNYLQPYLRDGKPIDRSTRAGAIAASGLDWLPPPKWRGLEVQKKVELVSPTKKFQYLGYKDLWLPYGGQPGFSDDLPVVADFKTTKSIRKYALNEEGLRKDPQAVIYAVNAILETKSKEVNLSWLYLQTEGANIALPTQVTVHTDEVAHHFVGIEKDGLEIVKLWEQKPKDKDSIEYALSVEGNRNACGDYGGCPFQHHCFKLEDLIDDPKVSGAEATNSAKECSMTAANGTIDLFAKLGKKKADASPPADAAPAAGPSTPPTQEQIAKEPSLNVNPPMPEGTPPAPPVGTVELKAAKGKRGRPAGSKNKTQSEPSTGEHGGEQGNVVTSAPEIADVVAPSPAFDEAGFDAAWNEFGAAVKKFLKAVA